MAWPRWNLHFASFIGKRWEWILRPIAALCRAKLGTLEGGVQLKRALKEGSAIRITVGNQE